MAETVLIDCGIWIDGNDFAGESNEVGFAPEVDTPENTTFKSNGWREYAEGGLKTSNVTLGGFFNTLDAERFASLGNERSVMLVPAGQSAGDVAWVVPVRVSSHGNSGSVGDLLGFAYAAQGNGLPHRAAVMDIRNNITATTQTTRLDLGALPGGQTLRVWAHLLRTAGTVTIQVRSSAAPSGPSTVQASRVAITDTGTYELTVDGPITDAYWFLDYITSGANPDFDAAVAASFAPTQAIVVPPAIIIPPPLNTVTLRGGLSADAIPTPAELTIAGMQHVLTFQPFSNMHVVIARLAAQPDITSVILSTDPTNQNQIGAFTKYGSVITVGADDYSAWVSNQELTFSAQTDIEAQ